MRDGKTPKVVLASASPHRKEILNLLDIDFEVVETSVEELESGDPTELALENARRKLASVDRCDETVIAADTVVALGQHVFGKPVDAEEATAFLDELSGQEHRVITAIAVRRPGEAESVDSETTVVKFRSLNEAEIAWYVSLSEWKGRAGGYAIQERGALLVEKIDGDYLNVVGLPVAKLLKLLPELAPNE